MARKKRTATSTPPTASRPHMPGYGIPKSKKGMLAWSWALQRLERSHNYWITTVRPGGFPHTMVVWAVWMDGRLYFSTGSESRKARNLASNPNCVVCTENAAEAVIVQGIAKMLKEAGQRQAFFSRYEKKYKWDMSTMQNEPVFEVQPRVVFGLYEKKFMGSATRWKFEKR
jgi:nitroimidazol reductase NimA-like FMN-containing flavoprotein (pyridoxamine 5'-phosphate oxidase superfamily)